MANGITYIRRVPRWILFLNIRRTCSTQSHLWLLQVLSVIPYQCFTQYLGFRLSTLNCPDCLKRTHQKRKVNIRQGFVFNQSSLCDIQHSIYSDRPSEKQQDKITTFRWPPLSPYQYSSTLCKSPFDGQRHCVHCTFELQSVKCLLNTRGRPGYILFFMPPGQFQHDH